MVHIGAVISCIQIVAYTPYHSAAYSVYINWERNIPYHLPVMLYTHLSFHLYPSCTKFAD